MKIEFSRGFKLGIFLATLLFNMFPSHSAPDMALPALTREELTQPTEAQSARLLELAKQVYKAKPWKKLEEENIFIVQSPADDTLLFVGAIGGSGEQAGVIVYRGAQSYFGLLDFLERASELPAIPQMAQGLEAADELMSMLADALSAANFDPMELMQLPQLQLMFEPREQLEDWDKDWIKRHKYTATGAGFPTFRAVSSGFLPWWISDVEADAMILALEQLLELVGRVGFSEDLVAIREVEENENLALELFARVPAKSANGAVTWSDERLVVKPDTELSKLEIAPNAERIAQILALPASQEIVEIALLGMSAPAGDAENRPYFPTLLLLGYQGAVVGSELLQSGFGDALPALIIDALVKLLAERATRPQTLQFSSPDLEILSALGQKLGISIEKVEELKTLDPAMEALVEQMETFDPDDLSDEEWAELEAGLPPKFPR